MRPELSDQTEAEDICSRRMEGRLSPLEGQGSYSRSPTTTDPGLPTQKKELKWPVCSLTGKEGVIGMKCSKSVSLFRGRVEILTNLRSWLAK